LSTPIEMMLDGVAWTAIPAEDGAARPSGGLPRATHEGVLEIFGKRLRCYRLDDGMCVLDADDVVEVFFTPICTSNSISAPQTAERKRRIDHDH